MVPGKVLQNSVSFRFVQELRKVIVNEFSFEMFYSSYFLFVFPNNDFERTQTRHIIKYCIIGCRTYGGSSFPKR